MRAITPIVVVCFVLAGCGTRGLDTALANAGPTAADTQTDAPTAASPPERAPGNPGFEFTDNSAIVNTRQLAFDSWSRVGGDAGVTLYFTVGSPDCNGVHATVRETSESVAVDLRSGSLPEAVGRVCTMIAVFGTLNVPLRSPLGDRKVLSVH